MKKGILLMAFGNENYYRMATVMAASIKVNEPGIQICLVTDNLVSIDHAKLFDSIKLPIKKSITTNGKPDYIKAKLFMLDYSPFDETIFLDVDQVMIPNRKLLPVFEELKNIDVTMSNTGIAETSVWADIREVQKMYKGKIFWNFHSEFVYFKKTQPAKDYFEAAKKVYTDNKIISATKFAGGSMADELAFQCASMITGIYPHKENWAPDFWFSRDKKNSRKYPYELTDYLTYSIGGNILPAAVKINYNNLAKHYFATLGLSNVYQVQDKRNFLPERKSI